MTQTEGARTYTSFNFSLDTEVHIHKRIQKDVLSVFGDVGGISGIVYVLISLLLGSFQEYSFKLSVVSGIYTQGYDANSNENNQSNSSSH